VIPATAEKAADKPAAPLASFLTKMAPKPAEKVAAVVTPETKEAKDAKPEVVATANLASPEPAPAQAAAKAVEKPEAKVEDKPKEEVTEKRLKDTQKWGNEEHKARLDAERKAAHLEAQLARIEAKLDGTYVEPTAPSAEQITADADATGRIRASHKAAVRQYGQQFVMETVWDKDSPYQELQRDPRIKARVMEADDPVLEAIAVVKEHQDGLKYGRTPEEIRKNIEAELAPKLKRELLEGLTTKPGPAVNTLGNARGGTERTEQKNEAPTTLDFRQVFPWGASRT
jgi:hypothetical protein